MPTNCQTEISASVTSAVEGRPSQGANQASQAHRLQRAFGDAPQRRQDQVPGEADDDHRQHGRQEDDRAIEPLELEARQAQEPCERDADRVLHRHVHGEENQIVPGRVPKRLRPDRVGQQRDEIGEADEMNRRPLLSRRVGRERHRRDRAGRSRTACRSRPRARETAPSARGSAPRGIEATTWDNGSAIVRLARESCAQPRRRFAPPPSRERMREGTRPRPRSGRRARALGEGAPLTSPGLYHLSRPSCSCLPAASGRQRAVDHLRRHVPEFVLEVRRAARSGSGRSCGSSTCSPCASRPSRPRAVLDRHRRLAEREEARQGVGVELREFRRRQPFEEFLRVLLVLRRRVHAHADVGVVGDVAFRVAGRQRRRERADRELRSCAEGRDVPRAGRIDRAPCRARTGSGCRDISAPGSRCPYRAPRTRAP